MKKKIVTLTAIGLILTLFACSADETASKTATDISATELASTTETTLPPMTEPIENAAPPPLPPREGAVMPPLQGGPMLYTFPAAEPYDIIECDEGDYPVYYLGIVNDMGEVVASPQYTYVKYAYDDYGWVNGVFAQKGKELTWYTLDGTAKKMPFQAAQVESIQNGLYWIVSSLGLEGDGYATCDGLYDTQAEEFIFPPKDGLSLRSSGGYIIGNQFESKSFDSKRLRGFQWNPADNSTREFPVKWKCQGYFPETGWYEMVEYYDSGDFEIYIVDQNMKIVPELLTKWHIDEHFDGGNYMVVRSRVDDNVATWVDRNGTFSKLRYSEIRQWGHCYIAWSDGTSMTGGTPTLLDGMLNILHKAQDGESIIPLFNIDHDPKLIVLTDKDNRILKAWNPETCKEINRQSESGYWFDIDSDVVYILKNGGWHVIDSAQYRDEAKGEDSSLFLQATEDGLIIQLAILGEVVYQDIRYIAIDWNGKPAEHPLLRLYESGSLKNDAGEQGPNYFWIEQGGKRGFINSKGEWLFKYN